MFFKSGQLPNQVVLEDVYQYSVHIRLSLTLNYCSLISRREENVAHIDSVFWTTLPSAGWCQNPDCFHAKPTGFKNMLPNSSIYLVKILLQ